MTRLAADLWPAVADPHRIELAVLNLVTNARDALQGAGEIRIETENLPAGAPRPGTVPAGDLVVLTVADTGDGMSPDVLARAFEPFFTTKPQGKGTGLGLAQVYGTARQLGGAITLRSRHGEGTTASIYLLRGEVVAGADADRTQGRGVATDATRILVVDDDPQVRAVAVTLLEELGYGVVEASGGAEALRLLHGGNRIDLLLTDYAMPGMTGTELAGRALALDPAPGVLMMTGYADAAALPSEGVPVLRKPFALDELRAAVERLLSKRPGRVLPFRRVAEAEDGGGQLA